MSSNFWESSANATNQIQRLNDEIIKNQMQTLALKKMLGLAKSTDEPSTSSTVNQVQKLTQPSIYWEREIQAQWFDNRSYPLSCMSPQIAPSQRKVSDNNQFIQKHNLNEISTNVLMNVLKVKKPINVGITADAAPNMLGQKVKHISLEQQKHITSTNLDKTELDTANSPKILLQRKPRRQPRIGAKFDFPPI